MAYFTDFTDYFTDNSLASLQISVLFCWKSPSESPYQDLLPQTSIYQELEYKEETPSCYPTDTSKQI